MSDETKELFSTIVRKIRLQRGVHDSIDDDLSIYIKVQKIANVLFSSFITLVVFADFGLVATLYPNFSGIPTQVTIGILSFILFIMNVLADAFQLTDRKLGHLSAIQQYTSLLNEIKNQNAKLNGNIPPEKIVELNEKYLQISKSSIQIGGNKFTKAHNNYLKKRCYALAMQKHPFATKSNIKKISIELVDECKNLEGRI